LEAVPLDMPNIYCLKAFAAHFIVIPRPVHRPA
jgi:hypothetical protein